MLRIFRDDREGTCRGCHPGLPVYWIPGIAGGDSGV
jgi:hypothetical protein